MARRNREVKEEIIETTEPIVEVVENVDKPVEEVIKVEDKKVENVIEKVEKKAKINNKITKSSKKSSTLANFLY